MDDKELHDRVLESARREWAAWYRDTGVPEPTDAMLSIAYRAIADHTLLTEAYHYRRDARCGTDGVMDVACRVGRYMHRLGDVFRYTDEGTRRET